MCDFPNVENNDFELEALSAFCEDWNRRIVFLDELFRQGRADESLILCCCYIEAIGTWFYDAGSNGEETFARALLRHGEKEIFDRINPVRLLDALRQKEDSPQWSILLNRLAPVLARFKDGFYPSNEITRACRSALTSEEFAALDDFLWKGALAGLAHKVTKCEEVHNGSLAVRGLDESLDFRLFYPALIRIFERARRLIMSGKLKVY
jgi:hypothetical protein